MSRIDLLITVIIAVIILVCLFLFVPPTTKINRLKEELQKQQEQHELLETKIAELDRQIDKIKNNDPEEIERIARDRRGYSRPGEVIYQLELPEPSATTTTPSTP